MLTNVQIISVPVSDQQAAHDFYVDLLGLSVIADSDMGPHGRWLQVGPDGAATTLALVSGDERAAPGSVGGLVFETTDIDGDVSALARRGVDFAAGIEDMPWARAARFADPDGNLLVLQTPAGARDLSR
ncbi:MAG TPA: VOC family protein [Euzebyales bacterium]|nr:VOC family protein [Euzebyales bacterium]